MLHVAVVCHTNQLESRTKPASVDPNLPCESVAGTACNPNADTSSQCWMCVRTTVHFTVCMCVGHQVHNTHAADGDTTAETALASQNLMDMVSAEENAILELDPSIDTTVATRADRAAHTPTAHPRGVLSSFVSRIASAVGPRILFSLARTWQWAYDSTVWAVCAHMVTPRCHTHTHPNTRTYRSIHTHKYAHTHTHTSTHAHTHIYAYAFTHVSMV